MQRIHIQHVPLQPSYHAQQKLNTKVATNNTFLDHLHNATNTSELKISKHANERLISRNIKITEQEWKVVTDKVIEAHQKGVNQPLVLMDQAALIVSAKNATVITAMERTEAKEQIFTNIDGTIVL